MGFHSLTDKEGGWEGRGNFAEKMKGKIVRVKLGKENLHDRIKMLQLWHPDYELQEVWDELAESESSAYSESLANLNSSESSIGASNPDAGSVSVAFGMVKAKLEDWTSDVSGYPRGMVSFKYPETDMERVMAWMTGDFGNVTAPASDALLRNVTSAVSGLLKQYFAAASGHNLFTSPFKVGWALRKRDGTREMTQPLTLMQINPNSPILPIANYSVRREEAQTLNDIINNPGSIQITPSSVPADWGDIFHMDIVATPQASLIPQDMMITGVTTVMVGDNRQRAYRYNRLDDTEVCGAASIQNDLRVIASIPVGEMTEGKPMTVQLIPGALSNWKLLDKFSTGGTGSGDGGGEGKDDNKDDEEDEWEPYIDRETDPLDLGDPERRKWVYMTALRGCFDRKALRIRVYASRHRQGWKLIADGRRGWVSVATHQGFRWFKVRVTGSMNRGDYVDAVSFLVTRYR